MGRIDVHVADVQVGLLDDMLLQRLVVILRLLGPETIPAREGTGLIQFRGDLLAVQLLFQAVSRLFLEAEVHGYRRFVYWELQPILDQLALLLHTAQALLPLQRGFAAEDI